MFNLTPEQDIHFEYDGERLSPPEGQIKDTEIEDNDCIDVYMK